MKIDDSYIADARERLRKKAQNEATCFALNDMLKDAQDEVRRLREENERLRENAKIIYELEQLAARSNNELLVENERLRKDAERYQWFRAAPQEDVLRLSHYAFYELDAAIDAARGVK